MEYPKREQLKFPAETLRIRIKLTRITTAPSIGYNFHRQMKYYYYFNPLNHQGKSRRVEMSKLLHEEVKVGRSRIMGATAAWVSQKLELAMDRGNETDPAPVTSMQHHER